MAIIYLIRHPEAYKNKEGITGASSRLTSSGLRQTIEIAQRITEETDRQTDRLTHILISYYNIPPSVCIHFIQRWC